MPEGKELAFRKLRADEISIRVAQCSDKYVALLLYRTARVDMNILDETLGVLGWQLEYTRDNHNCKVSVYDKEKDKWIVKEGVGTESNTESDKGLASDAFKRACACLGIGRELYTAPRIIVKGGVVNIGKNKAGKPMCNDKFKVEEIEYDEEGKICFLRIFDSNTEKTVFNHGERRKNDKS